MKKFKTILFCFIISFLILMIVSKSSFLYPLNDWGDANAFFTMGKSLFNGKIIFKEIFEQKGPFLYLIYGIGYLISNKSFLGVFLLEVCSSTVFLYYIFKIINLYLSEKKAYMIIPLFASLIYTSVAFKQGSSCEEFCFPFIAFTLYQILIFAKNKEINHINIYITGIMAGILFLTKYTLLGISFSFCVYVFINYIINKKFKESLLFVLTFLSGMITAFLPWLIYFIITNSLSDFINVYILVNIGSYSSGNSMIIVRIINCMINFLRNLKGSGIYVLIPFFGILLFLINKKVSANSKISLIVSIIISVLFIYIGGTYYIYYILPLLIYIIFAFIGLFSLFEIKYEIPKWFYIIYILLIMLLSYTLTPNKNDIGVNRSNLVQYKFSEIILKESNPTILNYGALDYGFYTVSGIVPNTKYFEKLNFSYEKYPYNIDELNRYIDLKMVDFVIFIRNNDEIKYPLSSSLEKNYIKISEEEQKSEGKKYTYSLYKLIGKNDEIK